MAASVAFLQNKMTSTADHAQRRHRALLRAVNQDAFDGVDVLDHARHQVARGALVEVADRQPLQAGKDVAAHVENDILLEDIIDSNAQAVEHIAQEEGQREPGGRQPDSRFWRRCAGRQ